MNTYKTTTRNVYGDAIEFLDNPSIFPVHRVRGDIVDDAGYLQSRSEMWVVVTPDGRAWGHSQYSRECEGIEIRCELWIDCIRMGNNFSPDEGEFERCGIKPVLCGSLAA